MSKRKLSYISNIPYSTNDGGRWLRKALDPADVDVDLQGMPDTTTNARAILNYQCQADVGVPDPDTFIATNVSSYDADLYLYQNPILFAMAVSYPQGTKDPSTGPMTADFANLTFTVPGGTAPRTVNLILNEQINGDTFYNKKNSFKSYCQRYRMIYGGVQGIPACSALFDSGTIEATQQIFNAEEISTAKVAGRDTAQSLVVNRGIYVSNSTNTYALKNVIYNVQRFGREDFADAGNAIQNPAALYCRYKEGVYMPYKIRNPLVHNYINSEEQVIIESPYVVTNEVYVNCKGQNYSSSSDFYSRLDYNPSTRVFSVPGGYPKNPNNQDLVFSQVNFYVKCYSKVGVPFWLVYHADATCTSGPNANQEMGMDARWTPALSVQLAEVLPTYCTKDQIVNHSATATVTSGDASDVIVGHESIFIDNATKINDIVATEPESALPFRDVNVGIINFRSIGVQASIRLIFRLGFELMVTAGSIYSPFKHKAPKYDEKAITNYIKACHNMRDAFLGNAATPEGHAEYSSNMNNIVSSINNPGTSWYGRVSV